MGWTKKTTLDGDVFGVPVQVVADTYSRLSSVSFPSKDRIVLTWDVYSSKKAYTADQRPMNTLTYTFGPDQEVLQQEIRDPEMDEVILPQVTLPSLAQVLQAYPKLAKALDAARSGLYDASKMIATFSDSEVD